MFRKLVSNLPFSPSLIHQLSFYSKRLKKEQFTRRIGLIFTILTLIVQSFTIFVPAKPTLAASTNDIVFGGGNLDSIKQTYVKGCDSQGRCDIKAIFNAYGIDAWALNSAKYENIYSSTENNYWSIGRAPRGYGGEVARSIPGGPTVYSRTLYGWAANKSWNAIRVETGQGTRWILTECGNIVTKESKPVPPPDMKMEKTASKSTVAKGEKFYFTLRATNIGGSTAKNVLLYDNSADNLELQPDGLGSDPLKHVMRWETHKRFDIGPGQSFTYRIYAIARADGTTLKNTACADFFDINVYNNCATATVNVPKTNTTPPAKCIYNPALLPNDPNCKPPVEKCVYNPLLNANDPKCKPPTEKCPYNPALPVNDPNCKNTPSIVVKKTSDKKQMKLGDTFIYNLSVTNNGYVNLSNAKFADTASNEVEFLEAKEPGKSFQPLNDKRKFTSSPLSLQKGQTLTIQLKAKVIKQDRSTVPNTVCVTATASNGATVGECGSTDITIVIEKCNVPGKENLPKNDPNCKVEPCSYNPNLTKDDPKCKPCPIEGKTNLWYNDPACRPCDETKQDKDKKDISCLELHKSARNITQDIKNANNTRANAGDTIEYTLSVKNFSKETRKGFVIEENMEDVLEYADIIDASGATYTTNPVRLLSWKPVDIKPGETIKRTVLIKVKSTLPTTPASSSDPLSNDFKMVNVYGDMVQIKLPTSPIKTVEQTVRFLPKTGLGSNVIVSTVLIMTATYFYYRSRLTVKELGLVRQQFNYGAGV